MDQGQDRPGHAAGSGLTTESEQFFSIEDYYIGEVGEDGQDGEEEFKLL